jgi:D-beta-D-heptose 7-phosphate kinase/D-beta-D-heptose 1-phosphate adenosyltransferase
MNELLQRHFDYKPKIAIFGDAMLDEYYNVNASRVSPEFPIPVLLSETGEPNKLALGGAANVCAQFSNFNVEINLFAIINQKIKDISRDIDTQGCIFSGGVPIKKRFYSDGFPLCRLDVEASNYGLENISSFRDKIFSNLCSSGPFDVVVFSDYNKGLLDGQKEFISELGDSTITIVDPKKAPIERWKGCSIIKPNSKEARDISGKEDPREQCEYFMSKTNCQAVIITQGGSGIFGNVMGVWFEYRPTLKSNVRSVVGAGDCFVAFLSMCMAHSIDIRKAVEIAFDACSEYVQKPYNTPIFPYQIERSKFIDPRNLKTRDFSLSFSNGCFDILHPGHLSLLEFAKSKSDKLVVAINSDESVRRQNKSHPLINNIEYRKQMIASLECVDFVVDFTEDTPYEVIKTIRPDVLVKGSDWPNPVGSDIVKEVCSFGLLGDYSTTSIIKKIKDMTK